MEVFEVGECEDGYEMGLKIGERFGDKIRSRLAKDSILHNQLLPFAQSPASHSLITSLSLTNRQRFPSYWDELRGTAHASNIPLLHLILINFRKEILPFLPQTPDTRNANTASHDCSDLLLVSPSIAVAAHNEDANVALLGHTYLIKATLKNGLSFLAYTYAGELPSCAFAFNSHGFAFTLNSVPPTQDEIEVGAIGRNFVSRHILEATSIDDALMRIKSIQVSVGHSYNLIEMRTRKIVNVETASRNRVSVHQVGSTPFFHANMYQHLQLHQIQDDNSKSRENRAAVLPATSKHEILSLLGDTCDSKYPIYMTGPTLYTLCTAVFDLDQQTLSIIEGNPSLKKKEGSTVFSMCLNQF